MCLSKFFFLIFPLFPSPGLFGMILIELFESLPVFHYRTGRLPIIFQDYTGVFFCPKNKHV